MPEDNQNPFTNNQGAANTGGSSDIAIDNGDEVIEEMAPIVIEEIKPTAERENTPAPAPAPVSTPAPAPEQTQASKDFTKEKNNLAKRKEELSEAVMRNNIPEFVNVMMVYAVEMGASDIHIEPLENMIRLRFRTDGVLREIIEYPSTFHPAIVGRIKIVSNLKIDEQRLPQDGRANLNTDDGREMDIRVSTLPTVNGEKICMRLQDKTRHIPDYDELGIDGKNVEIIKQAIAQPNGIFLVTGPTGSGKTTTLYSSLDKLNTEEVNIMTCEDPVEYQMDGLNQAQMRPEIGLDFASGLRTALRQDPDIIMVGEIRDAETIDISVRAALTGHLVLSTIHTNSSIETITRLMDMGAKSFLIASTVRAILAQRLVRCICPHCKKPFTPSEKVVENIKHDLAKYNPQNQEEQELLNNMKFFKGEGCEMCGGTGYKGRVGVYEAMQMTPNLQKAIIQELSGPELEEIAIDEGLITLKFDGIMKALRGKTTIEEIYRIAGY